MNAECQRAAEMVCSEKKRCENHSGVNKEGGSRFKKVTAWWCYFQVAHMQGFWDQETESLRPQDRVCVCGLSRKSAPPPNFAHGGGFTLPQEEGRGPAKK